MSYLPLAMTSQTTSAEIEGLTKREYTVSLRKAFSHCESVTRNHYENFPVGSRLIPRSLRPHVCSIYAFARAADDFADEPGMKDTERLIRLDRWEERLNACLTAPDGPVFTALAETIRTHHIPTQLLRDLLWAFRLDVTTQRYQTFDDLLSYCRYSANPIGRLILHLFGHRDERRLLLSDAICSALQLTNFWQDVAVDFSRGRVYIPQDDMNRFDVTEENLADERVTPGFDDLLEFEIARTETLFKDGRSLSETVTGRLKFELRLTRLGGLRILDKIRQNEYDVFRRRPRITALDHARLLLRCLFPKSTNDLTSASPDPHED